MNSCDSESIGVVVVGSDEEHDPSLNQKVEPHPKGDCMIIYEDKYGDSYLVPFKIGSEDYEDPDTSVLVGNPGWEVSDSESDTHETH